MKLRCHVLVAGIEGLELGSFFAELRRVIDEAKKSACNIHRNELAL